MNSHAISTGTAQRLRAFYSLTKPRVVSLIVFTAVIGMFLATPGVVPLRNVLTTQHHPEYENGPQSGQPEDDNTPAPGTICFITGNGSPGGAVGAADVDNGRTTLTSPNINLSGATDPHITFYYWYVTVCVAISLVVYWRMADTQRTSRIGRD